MENVALLRHQNENADVLTKWGIFENLLIHPFNTKIAAKLDHHHFAQTLEKSRAILKHLEAQRSEVDENTIARFTENAICRKKRSNLFAISSIFLDLLDLICLQLFQTLGPITENRISGKQLEETANVKKNTQRIKIIINDPNWRGCAITVNKSGNFREILLPSKGPYARTCDQLPSAFKPVSRRL